MISIDDERLWDILFKEACVDGQQATRIYKSLKEIDKRAEENGLLVWLPCKAGDRIWVLVRLINSGEWILYDKETIVTDIYLNAKRPPLFKVTNIYGTLKLADFGKTVFVTEEAARERLREVQDGQAD